MGSGTSNDAKIDSLHSGNVRLTTDAKIEDNSDSSPILKSVGGGSINVQKLLSGATAQGAHIFIANRIIEVTPQYHKGEQPIGKGRQYIFKDEIRATYAEVAGNRSHLSARPLTPRTAAKQRETALLAYIFKLWNVAGDGKLRQREVVNVLKELNTDPVLSDEYFEEVVLVMFGKNVYLTLEVFCETMRTNPLCASLLESFREGSQGGEALFDDVPKEMVA